MVTDMFFILILDLHFLLFSFPPPYILKALITTEGVIYFTPLSATAALEWKFRCQVQSITLCYQISIDGWQFNFAAQQSLIQSSSTFWEVRLQIYPGRRVLQYIVHHV